MPEVAKVAVGDRLVMPAELYNRLVDLATDQGEVNQNVDPATLFRQTGIVRIKNASGADRDRFNVLGIDNVLITPTANLEEFKQRVLLNGITPAAGHEGKFAILLEPIKTNEIGRAVVSGVTIAKVDMVASGDSFAEASPTVAGNLKSGGLGAARIVWVESGTGVKWAVIIIGAGGGGTAPIRVTSTTPSTEGYLPGFIQVYDPSSGSGGTWSDGEAIWVTELT